MYVNIIINTLFRDTKQSQIAWELRIMVVHIQHSLYIQLKSQVPQVPENIP